MKLKDKKIQIFEVIREKDVQGFSSETLQAVSPPLWAFYRQLSGKEIHENNATTAAETAEFIINFRSDITTRHVIQFRGETYDITRVDDYKGYKEDITLFCKLRGNVQ